MAGRAVDGWWAPPPREALPFVRVLTGLIVVLGLLSAAITFFVMPQMAVAGLALGVLVGTVAMLTVHGDGPAVVRPDARTGLTAGGMSAAGWLTLTGVGIVLGQAAWSVVLVAALLGATWLWFRFRFRFRTASGTPVGVDPAPPRSLSVTPLGGPRVSPSDPWAMSTPDLCLAWRRSYFALLAAPSGPGRCAVVRLREGLLDELERRDRAGFARWLENGARAGSDPGRFLGTGL